MAVFNGHDGVIRVLAQVVNHNLAAAAELCGDARRELPSSSSCTVLSVW
jgi:hypothetical protein